jgi:hypothetical protein
MQYMKIYRFSDTSPIEEIAIHNQNGHPPISVITADKKVPPEQLSYIRKELEMQGWHCVPATTNGKDVLLVGGNKNEKACAEFLMKRHFATGDAQISNITSLSEESSPTKKFLQRYSLWLAGVLNLVGDISLSVGGFKNQDQYKLAGGSIYTLGALNLSVFGASEQKEHSFTNVAKQTNEFLGHIEGKSDKEISAINLNNDAKQPTLNKSFLHHNAARHTLIAYTFGAVPMLFSGLKKRADGEGSAGIYYAVSSIIFKTLSLLIPEDTGKEGENKKPSGIVEWVKEKPMRIFGYGSLINDSFLAAATYQEFKKNPESKNYLWTALTTVFYIVSDVMAAISSKNPDNALDKLAPHEQLHVEAIAAEKISKQPIEAQEVATQKVTEFLSTKAEVKNKPADIVASIKKQVESLGHNPWASRVHTGPELAQSLG